MFYFNSRYLAENLDINLAKWKRWAREFLPSDPLGGFQSGYARQFNLKEAFRVHLGGQLVGALRLSIPEAFDILRVLEPLLEEKGFYDLSPSYLSAKGQDEWLIIYATAEKGFEPLILKTSDFEPSAKSRFGHMLNLSETYRGFINRVT